MGIGERESRGREADFLHCAIHGQDCDSIGWGKSLLRSSTRFPKWESAKNKSRKNDKFSSPKTDRLLTSVSPAIHHKFTIKKPRSAPGFCQNPQQKRDKPCRKK